MDKKRKRKDISIKTKLQIISACKETPNTKFIDVAKRFEIDASTVSKIFKSRDEILKSGELRSTSRMRDRRSMAEEVDVALFRWFSGALATSLPISGEILRLKAEHFAKEFQYENTTITDGFINRWKKRHGVVYKKAYGERLDADTTNATEWLKTKLCEILKKYKAEEIYNADETGIYYRQPPKGSHTFTDVYLTGSKVAKEKLTVLTCVNMAGEKHPLLVIGKYKNPRCFNGVKDLPIEYYCNKSAWMTSTIFEEWIRKWDRELILKKRKIALIVDNCTVHPRIKLENIELCFLPPNVTSLIQPCDQGIIRSLKRHYRRLIVLDLFTAIESSSTNIDTNELIKRVNVLEAMRLIRNNL